MMPHQSRLRMCRHYCAAKSRHQKRQILRSPCVLAGEISFGSQVGQVDPGATSALGTCLENARDRSPGWSRGTDRSRAGDDFGVDSRERVGRMVVVAVDGGIARRVARVAVLNERAGEDRGTRRVRNAQTTPSMRRCR